MPDLLATKSALKKILGITGEVVDTAGAQTLANKTLNYTSDTALVSLNGSEYLRASPGSNAIRTINAFQFIDGQNVLLNPGITAGYIFKGSAITTNRDVTWPLLTANDVPVLEAHTQTLTNKTVDAASNTLVDVDVSPLLKKIGWVQPAGGGTTAALVTDIGGILSKHTPTGGGTNAQVFDTTHGQHINYVSAASSGVNAGIVSPAAGIGVGRRLFGMRMKTKMKVDSTATGRVYFGVLGANALPISDTPLASGVPGVLVGYRSTDTNWQIIQNDATGAAAASNITGPIAKDTAWHTIEIKWAASGNVDVIFDGTTQTLSSDIPPTTNDLWFNQVVQTTSTAARTLSVVGTWIQVDK
jgi:hypothetical protein